MSDPKHTGEVITAEAMDALIARTAQAKLPAAIEDATEEFVETLAKARVEGEFSQFFGDVLAKADKTPKGSAMQTVAGAERPLAPRGLKFDPFTALDQMGFRERPTALTFQTLREMAYRCPPVAAILQTRLNQMAAFAVPQPDEHSMGFKIKLRDPQAEMTPELEKRAQELTKFMISCGNPDVRVKRPRLGKWMRMTVWDTLTYDQIGSEIVRTRKGDISYWTPLDASTIRVSDDLDESDDTEDTIQYVQVYDDTIIAEFREKDLMFGVRNPRSDIRSVGYGVPELETLITVVTSILHGMDYNAKFFSQGTVAKGLLNLKGAIPQQDLAGFRRHWWSLLSGVGNAHRVPVLNAEDVQWINMSQSNRDMEFSNWLDWLLKISAAIFQIATEEIGFQFGNAGQTSTLSEGRQEDKLKHSKDKGLIPLARFVQEEINREVLDYVDDRFCIEFAGINARTAEQLIDLQTKEGKALKTVDELRAERGMEPLPDGKGEVILDPTWLQFAQAKDMAGQEGEGGFGPDMGGLDQGGDEEDEDEPDQEPQDEDGGPGQDEKNQQAGQEEPGEDMERSMVPSTRVLNLEIEL